jgi:chromosome segregation ATPase
LFETAAQRVRELRRQLCEVRVEAEQLKLDGLRQRKQNSILRLKLASAKEDVDLLQRNLRVLDARNVHLETELSSIRAALTEATQQLAAESAERATVQADCTKYQVSVRVVGGRATPPLEPARWLLPGRATSHCVPGCCLSLLLSGPSCTA